MTNRSHGLGVEDQPHRPPPGTIVSDSTQGVAPDEVDVGVEMAELVEAALERVVGDGDVVAVGEQATLDPFDEVGAPWADVEVGTGLEQRIPERLGEIGAVSLQPATRRRRP